MRKTAEPPGAPSPARGRELTARYPRVKARPLGHPSQVRGEIELQINSARLCANVVASHHVRTFVLLPYPSCAVPRALRTVGSGIWKGEWPGPAFPSSPYLRASATSRSCDWPGRLTLRQGTCASTRRARASQVPSGLSSTSVVPLLLQGAGRDAGAGAGAGAGPGADANSSCNNGTSASGNPPALGSLSNSFLHLPLFSPWTLSSPSTLSNFLFSNSRHCRQQHFSYCDAPTLRRRTITIRSLLSLPCPACRGIQLTPTSKARFQRRGTQTWLCPPTERPRWHGIAIDKLQ